VTGLGRLLGVVVAARHDGADNGGHGAPLFWQVTAVVFEVCYVTWMSKQVSQTQVGRTAGLALSSLGFEH